MNVKSCFKQYNGFTFIVDAGEDYNKRSSGFH